jgi:hypothetical protein
MVCPYIPSFFVGVYHGKPSPEHQTEPKFLEPAILRLPWGTSNPVNLELRDFEFPFAIRLCQICLFPGFS